MKCVKIVFSPTGGTAKAAEMISCQWGGENCTIDLCDKSKDFTKCSVDSDDLVLIAVPSYGGRVPALAAERLRCIQGNGAACVLLCVYGNRAYEDTLVEMQDIAEKDGFKVISAVSAVAEHSIVRKFAAGRPDDQDRRLLQDFAGRILDKFRSGEHSVPQIPGNRPYKKFGSVGLVPKGGAACLQCGKCADVCPTGAISRENPKTADKNKCISCMRCVAVCPQSARKANSIMVLAASKALEKVCSVRKECELFI